MQERRASGTQGYAEAAGVLIERYERVAFADKHAAILPLLPAAPCEVIDIGAGTGHDAAALAAMGHRVVVVEPTDELRLPGMALHPSPAITWIADSLPELETVRARGQDFGAVLLTAVWMHLDLDQRIRAMPVVAGLVAPTGRLFLSLRHGPVPQGRRMFDVTPEETVRLAAAQGLRCILNVRTGSSTAENRHAGVTWTRLAFGRPDAAR